MLVNNIDQIPIHTVAEQLEDLPDYLFDYLDAVSLYHTIEYNSEIYRKFHEKQLELCVKYNPKKLLQFLRTSTFYNMDNAYILCESHHPPLYVEMVYLLSRMGNIEKALEIIIENLEDAEMAIELVEKSQDDKLWDNIIIKCVNHPKFLSGILEHAGSHVDPRIIISQIPEGNKIPKLKQKLIKVISDYTAQMQLRVCCNNILKDDISNILHK